MMRRLFGATSFILGTLGLAYACLMTVSITDPPSGTTYTTAQTVPITAVPVTTDNVQKVEFYDGATLKSTDTTSPYVQSWVITSADNATHPWTAKAYDTIGGSAVSPIVNLTVNIPTGGGNGSTIWAQRFGGTGQDYGYAAVVDTNGDTVLTGFYGGSVNFGGGVLPCANTSNIFLARFNAAGAHLWSKCFPGTGNGGGRALTLDSSGNAILTGYFGGTLNFGGGNLTSVGGYDIVVAKYSAAGAFLWANRYGSTYTGDGTYPESGLGVAADTVGNVAVAGRFYTTIDFGGGVRTSAGGSDTFLLQLTSAGAYTRDQVYGSASALNGEEGRGVAFGPDGALYVTGTFNAATDFGCGSLTPAASDAFVAKYSAGTCVWSKQFGASGTDIGFAIAVDASSNVFAAGTFQQTVNFGCGALTSVGGDDIYLAKLNSAGVCQWSKRSGGNQAFPGFDAARTVSLDGSGNAILTGWFFGTADFSGTNLTALGSTDIFVAKYLANGTLSWVKGLGGTNIDEAYGVGVNGTSGVSVTGRFLATADFGNGPLTAAGASDIFLIQLAP